MKIVFFGTGQYVLPILQVLNNDFELSLVLTTEKTGPVINFCKEHNIECLSVSSLSEEIINNKLSITNAPVAVLANFGLIIPQKVLDIFPYGIINVHPSLLPKYRGPTPGQTAILNGDKVSGVSIMKLDAEIDHGPILSQKEEPNLPNDTADTLYVRLFNIGAQLLQDCLSIYLSGKLKPREQDHSKATFTQPLTRPDGFIDLNALETKNLKLEIARRIRAFYPWPGVWFKAKLGGKEKIVKLLPNEKIQVEGKKEMNYKDFINGYPEGKEILEKLG